MAIHKNPHFYCARIKYLCNYISSLKFVDPWIDGRQYEMCIEYVKLSRPAFVFSGSL